MSDIPQAAIDAAALVLCDVEGQPEPEHYALADDVLRAAERVWPHAPPKRDPASSTACGTERSWQRTTRAPAQAFGFSLPDAYVGGASIDEAYRDEKWQDAQT